MALAQEDIQFIKDHLGEWLAEQSLGRAPAVYEVVLRERMVRVEEALKDQGELLKAMLEQMGKRFDGVDKRFEALQEQSERRFEAMDKSFDALQVQLEQRFEAADKRFESLQAKMDSRFEALQTQTDRRFDQLTRRIDRFMFWSFGITVSVGGLIVAVLKLWP